MAKTHKKAELPANPPRKSGRRGIGPREEDPRPRQARLPGTEDAEIEELEALAEEYVEVRDRRQALTKEEVPAKEKLLAAMHFHHKTQYRHGNVEIKVLIEKEKLRVRIKPQKADDDE